MEQAKNYNAREAEPRWQKYWSDNDIYAYHPDKGRVTYSVDTPPPTVSGRMHLGHAFSYSQQDIIVRFMRMSGKNVFFPFGTDDNGLPTERLIEKLRHINANQLERSEFVKICNEVVAQEKPKFIQSWKDIGMSADFKRSYSTINKHCQITCQASFVDLFHKGRIYQQESPVAWCVSCQTAIAQAEFESVDLDSKFCDVAFELGARKLVIATTRPELISACVALCYHPADARYAGLQGKFAKVPLFNYEVPIISDESVDHSRGTGLMMVCTFGDKEDVEKWHRHQLPLRVVFEKQGRMNKLAGEFAGLKIKDARQEIIGRLEQQGCLVTQRPIIHAVNVHERCKTEIEFLKTKQWYIRLLDIKEELLGMARQIEWYPPHMKVRYDHWVGNLGWDWCISRQRPFGIPIPVWQCELCEAIVVADKDELPVDPSQRSPKRPCSCGSSKFVAEKDVFDTWATSSLTPEIAGNWANPGEYEFVYANKPFDLRPQAHDIIRTWLFYTVVKSYLHFGRPPWKKVMISGHAQDSHGRKMSKSVGNIIEPQAMIQKYCADALRFWAAGSNLGDDLPFQDKDLLTGQRFITKLWNAARFAMPHLPEISSVSASGTGGRTGIMVGSTDFNMGSSNSKLRHEGQAGMEVFDYWLMCKLAETISKVTSYYENFEYAKAKAEIESFFWQVWCDNYLEIVKDRLYNPQVRGELARKSAQNALDVTLLSVIKLMAPIMPHITEEIYQLRYANIEGKKSVHISLWPEVPVLEADSSLVLAGDMAVDVIAVVRKFKSENKWSMKEPLEKLVVIIDPKYHHLFDRLKGDLSVVTGARTIEYGGDAPRLSEAYNLKVGIVR